MIIDILASLIIIFLIYLVLMKNKLLLSKYLFQGILQCAILKYQIEYSVLFLQKFKKILTNAALMYNNIMT